MNSFRWTKLLTLLTVVTSIEVASSTARAQAPPWPHLFDSPGPHAPFELPPWPHLFDSPGPHAPFERVVPAGDLFILPANPAPFHHDVFEGHLDTALRHFDTANPQPLSLPWQQPSITPLDRLVSPARPYPNWQPPAPRPRIVIPHRQLGRNGNGRHVQQRPRLNIGGAISGAIRPSATGNLRGMRRSR